MPFTAEHNYLTVHGTSYGNEIFTFGVRFAGTILDPTDEMATTAMGYTQTMWNTTAMGISLVHSLTHLKIARVLTTGLYPPGHIPGQANVTPDSGPGPSSAIPTPQTALCISTRSAEPRGLASRGRFYLPGIGVESDTTGHIPAGTVNAARDAVKTWMDSLNTIPGLGRATIMRNGVPAVSQTITRIQVGNRYDVQRRRGNAISETYTEGVLNP